MTVLGSAVDFVRRCLRGAGRHRRSTLTLIVGLLVAATATGASAEVYESVVESGALAGLDRPVLDAARRMRSPSLDQVVTAYTQLGGPVLLPVLAAGGATVLAIWWRSWIPVILTAVAGTGALTMTIAGKALTGRARPPLADAVPPFETAPSFPSGHALNALVVTGVLVYLLLPALRRTGTRWVTAALAGVVAVTIGLSRVYLGHHWLTDVLGAWALGTAWLAVVITADRLRSAIQPRRQPPR